MVKCKICGNIAQEVFQARVMGQYKVRFYQCPSCFFLQTEHPYWLEEAYETPLHPADTGIMKRNLTLSRIAAAVILFLVGREARCLDYAGGYGIFTRLMRDIGFDFYWHDKYAENLVARGFEYVEDLGPVDLVTSFECFEHFVDPKVEIQGILEISRNVLFTTMMLPRPVPQPGEWWYYALGQGQHVSFYSPESLSYIARTMDLGFCTNRRNLHCFTDKRVPNLWFGFLSALGFLCGDSLASMFMKSRTIEDMKSAQVTSLPLIDT